MSAAARLAQQPVSGGGAQAGLYLPGLILGLVCLLVLLFVALPRILSWYRARGREVLDPLQLEEMLLGAGVLVVDLREGETFRRKGHIRGCLHVPFPELPRRFGTPDPAARRPMVLVDESDALSHQAYDQLRARGFQWVYVLKGGMRAWRGARRPLAR